MSGAVTKTTGRPSLATPEIQNEICERLAIGESVLDICEQPHLPGETTIYRWLENDPIFREKYIRAREMQADHKFDQAWQIAKQATPENANVARLQVDTIKWQAGKLHPKKYGDLKRVEMSGIDGGAIQVETHEVLDVSDMSADERAVLREALERTRALRAVNVTPKGDE